LNECKKIDKLLWLYPNISPSEKNDLERHLKDCPDCRQAFETIQALAISSKRDQNALVSIDTAAFDAKVMRKIREQKAPIFVPQKPPEKYALRISFSFALAAMIVIFLVKSVSDLGDLRSPSSTAQNGEQDKYKILNLEIGRQAALPPPAAGEMRADATKKAEKAKDVPAIESDGKILATAPPVVAADSTFTLSMIKSGASGFIANNIATPESVSIGDIVLAESNTSPKIQQQYRASQSEYFAAPGSLQVAEAQSSNVVTIEKMPVAVKMVNPEYPVWARKQALSGTVLILARVEIDGSIKDVQVVSCDAPGLGFEEAALKAAKESVFIPASANGLNLPVWIKYPVKFICKSQ
jgi:TonB family protein